MAEEELILEETLEVSEQEDEVLEESTDEVVVILCVLQSPGKLPGNKKIWRRLAVPSSFSLLELHVSLQNAFDWENTHLHNYQQPKTPIEKPVPTFSGFGRTDISKVPVLDVDLLDQSSIRSFQSIIGIKEESDGLLTSAEEIPQSTVYVQHSHPHESAKEGDKPLTFSSPPQELLEERAFTVGDVLNPEFPVMVYEYDYGLSHQVTLLFQGSFPSTEGVNYPTCLAGEGGSRAEDGNDMDGSGNLLSSYDFEDFSVLDILDNFLHTYEDSWPLGPGAFPAAVEARCYMCRYNRECGRRSKCTGTCCDYCLKSEVAITAGRLSLEEADALYNAASEKVVESRNLWVIEGKCDWVEEDGQPCFECAGEKQ